MSDMTLLDFAAVAVYLSIWLGYETLFDNRLRRPHSINANMIAVREAWMRSLLERENRIVDSALVGHTIHTASFFASTTVLLVAALLGVLGSADAVYPAITKISVLLASGQARFEWKIVMLVAIFIYAFFKFTWAIRQFNYFNAVVGSAPLAGGAAFDRDTFARCMAGVLTHAVAELNAGVRAYYFAFAALGWFVHPVAFLASTLFMVIVIGRRQLHSPTALLLRDYAAALQRHRRPPA